MDDDREAIERLYELASALTHHAHALGFYLGGAFQEDLSDTKRREYLACARREYPKLQNAFEQLIPEGRQALGVLASSEDLRR